MSEKRPYTRNAELLRNMTCASCGKTFTHWSPRAPKIFSCDDCTRKLSTSNISSTELLIKYGINMKRALSFGWKPQTRPCSVCLKQFIPVVQRQIYCKKPECPSHQFKGRQKKITKLHSDSGEDPRKIVVCDAMAPTFNKLSDVFPGFVTKEEFDDTRKMVMSDMRGLFVKPSGMAAAIFYFIVTRKHPVSRNRPTEIEISKVVGITDVTTRKYVKIVKKSVEDREL